LSTENFKLTLFEFNIIISFNIIFLFTYYKKYTSDNEPDGIENATHNTFPKLAWIFDS
jgi:hypothetical protein